MPQKLGQKTVGDIYDVTFDGITVNQHSNPIPFHDVLQGNASAGISIQSNDGGAVSNVICKNYVIHDGVYAPIFIGLQDRDSKIESPLGSISDITIQNVVCHKAMAASLINTSCGNGATIKKHQV